MAWCCRVTQTPAELACHPFSLSRSIQAQNWTENSFSSLSLSFFDIGRHNTQRHKPQREWKCKQNFLNATSRRKENQQQNCNREKWNVEVSVGDFSWLVHLNWFGIASALSVLEAESLFYDFFPLFRDSVIGWIVKVSENRCKKKYISCWARKKRNCWFSLCVARVLQS